MPIYLIIVTALLIGGWAGATLSQQTDAASKQVRLSQCERINAAPRTLAAQPKETPHE